MIVHGIPGNSAFRGKALRFNGSTQHATIAHAAAWDFERTDSWTVSLWLRFTGSGFYLPVSKIATGVTGWYCQLNAGKPAMLCASNFVSATPGPASGWVAGEGTTAINDGRWHFVTWRYAGTSLPTGFSIDVDGVAQTMSTAGSPASISATIKNTQPVILATRYNPGTTPEFSWPGEAFGLQIHSVCSTANHQTLYNGRAPKESVTAGTLTGKWWVKASDTAPTIVDSVAARNMTLVNTPTIFSR